MALRDLRLHNQRPFTYTVRLIPETQVTGSQDTSLEDILKKDTRPNHKPEDEIEEGHVSVSQQTPKKQNPGRGGEKTPEETQKAEIVAGAEEDLGAQGHHHHGDYTQETKNTMSQD